MEAHGTWHILEEVLSLPTLIALGVIALGVLCWVFRKPLAGLAHALRGVAWAAKHSFGFEAINRGIVKGAQACGDGLRVTQTGALSWNVFMILAGFVVVLALLIGLGG